MSQKRGKRHNNFKKSWKRKKQAKFENNKCEICKEKDAQYRCSKCRIVRYCSLNCSKIHNNSERCKNLIQERETKEKERLLNMKEKENEEISVTGYVVSDQQLLMLEKDNRIRQALTNDHLRNLICQIDSSSKPQMLLESIIAKDEHFGQFVDYMLHVIQFHDKSVKNYQNKSQQQQQQQQQNEFEFLDSNEKIEYLLKQALLPDQ